MDMDRTSGRKFKKKKKKNKDLGRTFKVTEENEPEVEFAVPGTSTEWVTTLGEKTGNWINILCPYGLRTRETDRVAFIVIQKNSSPGPPQVSVSLFLNGINLWNLSLLTDEDLQILGVEDATIRKLMLFDFVSQPLPRFDDVIEEFNWDWQSYNIQTMHNIILGLRILVETHQSRYNKLCGTRYVFLNHHSYRIVLRKLNYILHDAYSAYGRMVLPKKKSLNPLDILGSMASGAGIILVGYCLYKLSRLI